jgi:hypothetical protein
MTNSHMQLQVEWLHNTRFLVMNLFGYLILKRVE